MLSTLFPQFLEEIQKSPAPKLEHPRAPGDLADAQSDLLGNLTLGDAFVEHADELPAPGDARNLLRREEILQEHLGFAGCIDRSKELVETVKGGVALGHLRECTTKWL